MNTLIWLVLALAAPATKEYLLLAPEETVADDRQQCSEKHDCVAFGDCTPGTWIHNNEGGCFQGSTDDCRLSSECLSKGACTFDEAMHRCLVKDKNSCTSSAGCSVSGLCHYSPLKTEGEGSEFAQCVASDKSCRASFGCRLSGACNLAQDGSCRPQSDADCKKSKLCTHQGFCHFDPQADRGRGLCQVGLKASVQHQTPACTFTGACQLEDESSPNDTERHRFCEQSTLCTELGWCQSINEVRYGRPTRTECGATSCEQSQVCLKHGACTAVEGVCVVRPKVLPRCSLERIYDFQATASSTRPTDTMGSYSASHLVDRDSRTVWAPANDKATGATLTLTLPKAEKVAHLSFMVGSPRQDRFGDWSWLFNKPLAMKVSAGEVHDLVYRKFWMSPSAHWMVLTLPPTETDTVTVELLLNGIGAFEKAPVISEVQLEVCR